MREFLVYTAARFAVFAGCVAVAFAVFALLGADDDVSILVPLLLGAVASVMVSAWLLRGLRERFVLAVQARAERRLPPREGIGDPADGGSDSERSEPSSSARADAEE